VPGPEGRETSGLAAGEKIVDSQRLSLGRVVFGTADWAGSNTDAHNRVVSGLDLVGQVWVCAVVLKKTPFAGNRCG